MKDAIRIVWKFYIRKRVWYEWAHGVAQVPLFLNDDVAIVRWFSIASD